MIIMLKYYFWLTISQKWLHFLLENFSALLGSVKSFKSTFTLCFKIMLNLSVTKSYTLPDKLRLSKKRSCFKSLKLIPEAADNSV